MLDLFSGIGGFSLAAKWVWGDELEIVAFVEIDKFCQKVLKKHWPEVPIISDIREVTVERIIADTTNAGIEGMRREWENSVFQIDLICGGFPCQPFSCAGKRKGRADDRFLWPEMLRVVREVCPTWVIAENVGGLFTQEQGMVFGQVLSDLENEGYEVQPFIIPACGVNAPHRRNRVWIIAYSSSKSTNKSMGISKIPIIQQRCQKFGSEGWEQFELVTEQVAPSKWWTRGLPNPRPLLIRDDDGIPNRVDRLKALGNSIVPQVAYEIMKGIRNVDNGYHNQSENRAPRQEKTG